jgi:hypothetical protein
MAGGVDDAVDSSDWAGLGGRLAQGGRNADGHQDQDQDQDQDRGAGDGAGAGPVPGMVP